MAVNTNEPVNTTGPSQTEALIDAFKSGRVNLGGSPDTSVSEDTVEGEESQGFSASDILDSIEGESLPSSTEDDSESLSAEADSEDSAEEKEAQPETSGDIEELVVTGPNGRRKVTVDFSDRDKLKKHVQLAYGARKWQKERDDARSELGQIKDEYTQLKTDWDKIEKAYQSKGVEGLVDLLEGREGAYQDFRRSEVERELRFRNMSDSEREAYDQEQARITQERENQKLREEYERKLKEIDEKQEIAEMRSLESKIHPSFDRYRFKGKLGDEIAETEFDEMLWNRALASLEKIADEDIEITQAMVDKEFRRIAQTIKKHLNTQVENQVKRTISKQKKDATKKVQARVSKGMKDSAEAIQFRDSMRKGDIVSGLTSFFKAGGKLNR